MKGWIIAFISAIVLIPIILYIAGHIYFSDTRQIKDNWGIELPSEFKVEYSAKETGFHGDGERYTVFQTRGSELSFIKSFSMKKDKDVEEAVQSIVSSLGVPEEYQVSFKNPYLWWKSTNAKDGSTLIIICLQNSNPDQIYFVEKLM